MMAAYSVFVDRCEAFRAEANAILGNNEQSIISRAYNAHSALLDVSALSLSQTEMLKQSVRCVEAGLFRAAFVMAWTAVADLMGELAVASDKEIKSVRPNWKFSDKSSLFEISTDHHIVEALRQIRVLSKSEAKSLHGMLHRRNESAHPSDFFPGANEALGFIDESVRMCQVLSSKLG